MKSFELNRQYSIIENLINSTSAFSDGNIELQGHWGKYLCILSAGFLENAISEVFSNIVSVSAAPFVSSYAQKNLRKIQNPKSTKFIEVAYAFKKEWGENLTIFLDNDPSIKEAIDSIMANRNLIAHGKTSSISVARIKEYLNKSIKLIEFVETQWSST